MLSLASEVRTRYHIAVSPQFVERLSASAGGGITAEQIYRRAINENFKDITDVGALPRGAASQVSGSIASPLVLQINSSRDVTQPMRPCADSSEEEMAFGAALQRASNKRLLRLVLSDGHTEIPAIELSTLSVFSGIPIPGEKILVKEGAEIKNGAILMTENCVVPLGGEVLQLKQEFFAMKSRGSGFPQASAGLEVAQRFQPLRLGATAAGGGAAAGTPVVDVDRSLNGGGSGRGKMWGRGGRGSSRGGRGYAPRRHRGH